MELRRTDGAGLTAPTRTQPRADSALDGSGPQPAVLEAEPAPRASDQAYSRILEMILDLRLPPGAVLNEQQLAAGTGFGRMPVREAVARLCTDRFVTVVPRRGTYVTPVGLTDVLEMFEAREAIECGVAFIAARRITADQLDRLRVLVGRADHARSDERAEDHLHDDHAIHAYLVEVASNGLLRDAADRLLQHNLRFWRSHWSSQQPRPSIMLPHDDLLAALEAHDPQAAEQAMRAHISASRAVVQAAFER